MSQTTSHHHAFLLLASALAAALLGGCAGEGAQDRDFHTSGSRAADQRAEQRVSEVQQMRGEGEGGKANEKSRPSLFERLGGDSRIGLLVDDFVHRAIADPRANWERKGIKRGGVLGLGARSAEWKATDQSVARLEEHLTQFIVVATGGPSAYEGRDLKDVHRGMHVTNAEVDASMGAFKASLDALHFGTTEQKELLAILESARPMIVEDR